MNRLGIVGKLVCAAMIISVALLAFTGFWAMFRAQALGGYLLMVHCTVAPVFCFFLAAMAVIWSGKNCFERGDWRQGNRAVTLQKVFFWLMILAGIPVILSMVLSMVPLYGTNGQEFLYQLHRYCALFFVLVAIWVSKGIFVRRSDHE